MKKLLFLTIFLTSAIWSYGQTTKWVWPDVLRAFNQTTGAPGIRTTALYAAQRINDSTAKVLRLEFKKADTALHNTLPKITPEAMKIVTTLPDVVKSLEDKIKQVQAPAADTSWKAAVRDQQATITAQGKLINDLTTQLSELKLWADKVKLINFK